MVDLDERQTQAAIAQDKDESMTASRIVCLLAPWSPAIRELIMAYVWRCLNASEHEDKPREVP